MFAVLISALALTPAALKPPHLLPQRPAVVTAKRCAEPQALLPKAIIPVLFTPWIIQITYAIEQGLKIDGPATKIVRSDIVQKGTPLRQMKKEPPKVRGVRLPQEARAAAATARA